MKKNILLIPVTQPIGTFYIGKMAVEDLLKITFVSRRNIDFDDGIQRNLDIDRANKINEFINDPDATFPTPIIISVKSSDVEFLESRYNNEMFEIEFDDEIGKIGEIIDGQHRIEGIRKNPAPIEELPVVIMFDLTSEEKAYVFSVINSNQKPVSKSLIYDLFELYETRSPVKTCHTIVKALNSDSNSPFYNKVKMLGRRTQESETISQGMFVDYIVRLISNNPAQDERNIKNGVELEDNQYFVLRHLFITEQDQKIYKILFNYFSAISDVFYNEWEDTKSIIVKTTGIGAFLKAFPTIYSEGVKQANLSIEFFSKKMEETKMYFMEKDIYFTADSFGSGEKAQRDLSNLIIKSWGKRG